MPPTERAPAGAEALLPFLRERRLTVLAGAGISMIPPSCLPSWWQLNHAVLDALSERASEVTRYAQVIIDGVKKKQEDGLMPPEYTSEVIADSIVEGYFEVLRCLEGERFNAVHAWLAALVKAQRLPVIITTNFDTLIERACEAVGAPLQVLVTEADYAEVDIDRQLDDPSAPTLLLKLHGTATEPTTCIDTLAQRKQGLGPAIGLALQKIVGRTHVCLLGYSGADLDAEPNYLHLRQMASQPQTPGFSWLMLPEVEVMAAVHRLVDHYADPTRARIVRGSLPDWLEDLAPALEGTGVEPPRVDLGSAQAQAEHRAAAQQSLTRQARAWGDAMLPLVAALIIDSLGERVPNAPLDEAREEIIAWANEHAPGTQATGVAHLAMAASLRSREDTQRALAHTQAAMKIFQDLEDGANYDDALAAMASILVGVDQLEDAERVFRQSLEVSEQFESDEARIMRWQHLASVVATLGRPREALELVQRAHDTAVTAGDEPARASALERLAALLGDMGQREEALEHLREAATVRRRLGQLGALGYNLNQRASLLSYLGDYEQAHAHLDEAERIAQDLGNDSMLAAVAHHHAGVLAAVGRLREAVVELRRAIEIFGRRNHKRTFLQATVTLVGILASQGELDTAIADGEAALEHVEKIGMASEIAKLRCNVGIAHEMAGHLDEAAEHYDRAFELGQQLDDPHVVMMATGNLANLRYRQGNLPLAREGYAKVIAAATQAGEHPMVMRTLTNLANIAVIEKDYADAERYYLEALRVAEEHGLEDLTGNTLLNLGQALWGMRELDRANETLETAERMLRDQDDRPNAGTAAWYRVHVLLALQRPAEAKASAEAMLSLWEGLERPEIAQARSIVEQLTAAGV